MNHQYSALSRQFSVRQKVLLEYLRNTSVLMAVLLAAIGLVIVTMTVSVVIIVVAVTGSIAARGAEV